jgi:hypothetical protein
MASYTDIAPKFNPYIQQLPVEAMAKVGMEKQRRYDEGLQKIQQGIDNVAGISLLRGVDKNYLQTKLNELGSNLKTVAAGDFSNYQLVNSVGGMTNQIAKDKFIQAGAQSSAFYKKQQELIEEDRKKGSLSPSNETVFNDKLNGYLNSELKNDKGEPVTFNSRYTPYFDVFKHVKEAFDAVKPDEMSFDQVYITGPDGKPKLDKTGNPIYSPVMLRMEKEGIFPEKVKAALEQAFADPRVSQQLQIDGQYAYRSVNPEGLVEKLQTQMDESLTGYNDRLVSLQLDKSLGKDVDKDINSVEEAISKIENTYTDYAKMAGTNPDGLKGMLYQSSLKDRYTTMFGWQKTKTATMDNPGWRANFDMLKEANEQSRFAQTLGFNKQKHFDDMNFKMLEYQQRERLAKTKKGKNGEDVAVGMGVTGQFEQGDEPSDIDMIKLADQRYDDAASDFINTSDKFIWDAMISKSPVNQAKYKRLIDAGNSDGDAVRIILDGIAEKNNESPESLRARWGKIADVKINKTASNKVSHELKDAHANYKNSKKQFDVQVALKKRNEQEQELRLGSETFRELSTADIKPQKIKLYDKEYDLSKSDIYDLSVYLKGHEDILSGASSLVTDKGVRRAGIAAGKRLEQKGLTDVLEALMKDQGPGTSGIVTGLVRGAPNPFSASTYKDIWYGTASNKKGGTGSSNVDWGQVKKLYSVIDKDQYTEALKIKSDIIKRTYGIQPNLKTGILTGNSEDDKATIFDLRRAAGAYTTGQAQNLSVDFKDFSEAISGDIADFSLEATVIKDAYNNPQVEVVAYDVKNGKRKAGLTLAPDEARSMLNIDVNNLYEPKEVSSLKNLIMTNGNKTSNSPYLDDKQTYIDGDAYFEKSDLPGMSNSPYDMKANIKYANGLYYGYIYVADPSGKSTVQSTPGTSSLTELYKNIQQNATPAWAQAILSQR